MTFLRPVSTFLPIFSLLTILFSSCTITQRRYRSGFHLEWKHRHKTQESNQTAAKKDAVAALIEQPNADEVEAADNSIRPTEEKVGIISRENVEEPQIVYHPFPLRHIEPINPIRKSKDVNHTIKAGIFAKKNVQKQWGEWYLGEILVTFLVSLVILVIPPALFSAAAYWIDLSDLGLFFVWLIWLAGIVSIFFLFSGLWPIILSCLIWNIVFTITTLVIVLSRI